MRLPRRIVLVSALAYLVACGGGDSTGPAPKVPTSIGISAGTNQTAAVATAVPIAPAVLVRDQNGDPMSGVDVTFTVQTGGGTITGGTATSGANGVATVGSWTLGTAAGSNTLQGSVTGLTPVTINATGTAGTATALVLTTPPSPAVPSGGVFAQQPVVQLHDAYGNDRAQAGVPVTVSITSGGGTLNGTLTENTDATGAAVFTNLEIIGTVGPRTLTFTSPGLTSVGSGAIDVLVGTPTAIVATTSTILGGTVGQPVSNRPTVQVTDASGNPVVGVTVTFTVTAGGGSVTGGSSPTGLGGIAQVTSWTLGTVAGSNTLDASVGSLAPVAFEAAAQAGPPAKLAISTAPSTTAPSGSVLAQQPVIRLQDEFGNDVIQAGVAVTVSRSPTSAGLGGTVSINTDATGVATFTDLSLTGTVGSYALDFASTGLTSVTSSAITLTAGPAANILALSTPTQSAGVGANVANPPSIQVTDVSGNAVSGAAVTFTVTAGGGNVSPNTPITTDATGIATLAGWTLGTSVGGNTVNATTALVAATVNFDATGTFQVAKIAAGSGHSCAVTVDGVGFCWGDNIEGALGDNSFTNRLTPTAIAGGHTFSQISAGRLYSCALTGAGAAWCWGRNAAGALGNGTTASDSVPQPVSGGMVFQVITTGTGGGRQTCAINSAGTAYCWGADGNGQLGNGAPLAAVSTPDAVQSMGTWTQLAAGAFYSCGVRTSGVASCWGADGFGQLGNGAPKANTDQPSAVIGGLTFSQVAPGQVHTCGLSGGAAYCWGANLNGRLGQDTVTTTESLTPLAVTGGLTFSSLVSGESFSCGLTAGGVAYCWGYNEFGQLGNGSTDNATTPTPVAGGISFASLSAGAGHVCGVTSGGQAYCWGDNSLGQLGDGTVFQRETPTPISQP
jgi:alpha-tubulin suppressor-like RCC1 family protein